MRKNAVKYKVGDQNSDATIKMKNKGGEIDFLCFLANQKKKNAIMDMHACEAKKCVRQT